jgi:hypothetical protein
MERLATAVSEIASHAPEVAELLSPARVSAFSYQREKCLNSGDNGTDAGRR